METETNHAPVKSRRRLRLLLAAAIALLLAGGGFAAWRALTSAPAAARVLYIGWDDADSLQLFLSEQDGETSTQLTTAAGDVMDFAVAPGGRQVAYVVQPAAGGNEIWRLAFNGRSRPTTPSLLLACPDAGCRAPVWHPDGRRLVYERREMMPENGRLSSPTLWWLDTHSGETISVLEDIAAPAMAATISPDGQWLSYASPQDEGVHFFNLDNGRRFFINSQTGAAARWDPAATHVVVSDVQMLTFHGDDDSDHLQHSHDFAISTSLFLTDVYSQARRPLTGDPSVDDGAPVWSPDGQWILFGRKPARTDSGRQLYLVRPDGSALRALTDDLTIHHGAPAWSPDGRSILFQRVNVLDTTTRPQIWLLSVADGHMKLIAAGFHPAWLTPHPTG